MTMTVTKMIETLLIETTLSNTEIVNKVLTEFPNAKTTTKSVASTASVMRRFGIAVAKRPHVDNSDEIVALKLKIEQLEMMISDLEVYSDIQVAA